MDDPVKLEAIAQLRHSPGFQALLEIFDEEVKASEEELAYCAFSAPKLYGWQVVRHIARTLRNEPEKAAEIIQEERLRAPQDMPNISSVEMFKKMQAYYREAGIEFPARTKDVQEFLAG